MRLRADSRWTPIALTKAMSAQAKSWGLSPRTFKSTRRTFHARGSIEATVNSPSGGCAAFLRMNGKACLKLQKVSGNSG